MGEMPFYVACCVSCRRRLDRKMLGACTALLPAADYCGWCGRAESPEAIAQEARLADTRHKTDVSASCALVR